MKAGDLRHQITIQENQPIQNPAGPGMIDNWVDGATVWAQVQLNSGREFFQAKKINDQISGVFKIRYIAGVNSAMRVRYGTRFFDIVAVIDVDERRQELQINSKEVINHD
jgi:SPP1 family predicted phage head-tail adaptor